MAIENILRIAPFLLGLIFSFQFFTLNFNSSIKYGKVLAIYMLFISIRYFASFFIWAGAMPFSIYLYPILIPFCFADLPILYIYISLLTVENYKISFKNILIHFFPIILILLGNIIVYFGLSYDDLVFFFAIGPFDITSDDGFFLLMLSKLYIIPNEYLTTLQSIIYSILFIILFFRHKKKIKHEFSYKEGLSLNWFIVFYVSYILFFLYDILQFYFIPDLIINVEIIFFIIFISYFGMTQKVIYKATEQNIRNIKNEENFDSENHRVLLSDDKILLIDNLLKEIMDNKKMYTQMQLTLDDVATELNINRRYLSEVINKKYKKNFYAYINEYRILESKRLLKDENFSNYSIEGIANIAGFQSKSTFNTIFKRIMKLTPSQYRNLK